MIFNYKMRAQHVNRFAILTIIASIVGIAGDLCILLYAYRNNVAFPYLINTQISVLILGAILGCCAIFIYMLGSAWLIAYGLRASNLAKSYFISAAATTPLVIAGHALTAVGVAKCVPNGSTEIFSSCLLNYGNGQIVIVWLLLLLGFIIMCFFLAKAILSGVTLFPRLMAFINPLVLVILLSIIATTFREYAQAAIFVVPSLVVFCYTLLTVRAIKMKRQKIFEFS